MKWTSLVAVMALGGIALTACGAAVPSYSCTDRLGCIAVASAEPLKIGALLTLTTPDSPYGIDALRGVEMAITTRDGSRARHRLVRRMTCAAGGAASAIVLPGSKVVRSGDVFSAL
jgi:hypothetical protein